jgi:tetratricopeptide (TPR) repeat protein
MNLSWTLHLWPGFQRLWTRGELYSLFVALLFATILDIVLLATLVWTEWLASWLVLMLWLAIVFIAMASLIRSFFVVNNGQVRMPKSDSNQLLAQAQQDYLRGDYVEAEASLHQLLNENSEDIEGALFLATIFRRTQRLAQASELLDRIERFESASAWYLEIQSERHRIMDRMSQG